MITIDKLTVQLPGISEEEGWKLARELAEELAMVALPQGCSESAESVGVNITQPPGASGKKLSQQIVAEMLRQLDRTV
jgi:hypothetical protein